MTWAQNDETWVPGPAAGHSGPPLDPAEHDWLGQVVDGRYEIVERVGGGGFGNVFRARDRRLGSNDVAVKILRRDRVGGGAGMSAATARRLFDHELQVLAELALPGVVRISDCGVAVAPDGVPQPYLVSEFVAGQPLADPDPLPDGCSDFAEHWRRLRPYLEIVDQVGDILAKVHGKGVAHGDLKPDNILIRDSYGSTGLPCVVDFGCAALYRDPAAPFRRAVMGTAKYMAPEAFRGDRGPATDQFALGVMLFDALCDLEPFAGAPPASGDAAPEALAAERARHSPLVLPGAELAPLAKVVARATQPAPEARYPDIAALCQALRQACGEIARQHNVTPLHGTVDPGDAVYPHLAECLVVTTAGRVAGRPGPALFAEVLAPAIASVQCDFPARPLRPVWQPAEDIERDAYDAVTVERFEHARLIVWVVDGLGPRVLRLLSFHERLGRAITLQAAAGLPTPATWHLAPHLFHLGAPAPSGGPLALSRVLGLGAGAVPQTTLEALLRQALVPRWVRPALVEHWHRWSAAHQALVGQAFKAILDQRKPDALDRFRELVALDGQNPLYLQRYARFRAEQARGPAAWDDVIRALERVTAQIPELAPAWRDLGVARDKVGRPDQAIAAFERANALDPHDYDAWSALGGVQKRRAARLREEARLADGAALRCYDTGVYLSEGHPYPLLNAYRLRLLADRQPTPRPDPETRRRLEQAVVVRQAQSAARIDWPWCDLDLAEALLYLGRPAEAQAALERAAADGARFPFETFGQSLDALAEAGVALPGLGELRTRLSDLLRERETAPRA